jgi:uncharacterized peroxidase-related enzyme
MNPPFKPMEILENERPSQRDTHGANLDVVDEANASPEIKRLYKQFREDFGRPQVPGILQCFATHPPLLIHMIGLAKSMLFVDGALGRQHKEMISTFVSASNLCSYCTDSHAWCFRMQGGSAHALDAVLACDLEAKSITFEERTLLQFVKKITEDSQSVAPSDIEAMRAAGWTDLQIAEAIHVTALFATFNRVVNAFGLPSQNLLPQFEQSQSHEGDGAPHA